MPDPKYHLSPEEALAEMRLQLAKMEAETDRNQLKELTPDDAFEKGYAAAIFDFAHYTGPSPREEALKEKTQ